MENLNPVHYLSKRSDCNLLRKFMAIIILSLNLTSAKQIFSGGYEWAGLGAKALGKGGAFIGEVSDWTAIYWNPAGLLQLSKFGAGFSLVNNNTLMYDGNSFRNFDTPSTFDPLTETYRYDPQNLQDLDQNDVFARVYYTEPDRFDLKDNKVRSINPNIGLHYNTEKWAIGVGAYIPIGNITELEDRINDTQIGSEIQGIYKNLFYIRVITANFAYRITDFFYLGVGINILHMNLETEIEKFYKAPLYLPQELQQLNYSLKSTYEVSGDDYEGAIGFLLKLNPNFQIGGIYRTGATLKLKGRSDYIPGGSLTLGSSSESSDVTQSFPMPSTYGVGAFYRLNEDLSANIDFYRTSWSGFKADIDFEHEGEALQDRSTNFGWKNSIRLRFGIEYEYTEKLTLRAGTSYDQTAIQDRHYSLTFLVTPDIIGYITGIGYRITNSILLDAAVSYANSSTIVEGVKY
ncbi:MAG: OmpP1/FadL family transporter, partial [Fidelibacterota bacterium]